MRIIQRVVFNSLRGIILIAISLLLVSCGSSGPGGSKTTQPSADSIFTAAAQTAEYRRIERITQTAAKAPVEPTKKVSTQAPPETTALQSPSADTSAVPTSPDQPPATITRPATDAAVVPGEDKATFIVDINVPDGTKFQAGKHFQKTWRIENTGKTTWTGQYALVFIDGDLMGASSVIALPQEVKPWEKVSITVDMVAPSKPGKYTGYWKLRNASGKIFGFGETGHEAIWVQIVVESGLASEVDTSGQVITSTFTANQTIQAVSLSVDNPEFVGCPHTFRMTALIDLNQAAMVTYNLEGADDTGSPLRLPIPATRNLDAGAHPVIYELTFSRSIIGWARLRITQPEPLISDEVKFSLTCG